MDFWDVPGGYVSNLYAPPFTLAGFSRATLSFNRAYAREDFGNLGSGPNQYSLDSLYIEVSTDCGSSWQNVYTNGAATMATAPQDSLEPFTPTQSQWVNDSASLNAVAGYPDILLRFKAVSGNGNDLYMDNINITGNGTTGIEILKNVNCPLLYPNPANSILNVILPSANLQHARIPDHGYNRPYTDNRYSRCKG